MIIPSQAADAQRAYEHAGLIAPDNVGRTLSTDYPHFAGLQAELSDYELGNVDPFGLGEAMSPLLRAAIADNWSGEEHAPIRALSELTGRQYAWLVHQRAESNPANYPVFQVNPQFGYGLLHFGDGRIAAPISGNDSGVHVIDLGAGVAGARFIHWQYELFTRRQTSRYTPVNRAPMPQSFLEHYRAFYSLDGIEPEEAERFKQTAHFSPVLSGLGALSASQLHLAEGVDLVMANGLGHAQLDEVAHALEIVLPHMRQGGILAVGVPVEPLFETSVSQGPIDELTRDHGLTPGLKERRITGANTLSLESQFTMYRKPQ